MSPMVGSVAVFILLANILSVFPAFSAPTAEISVPLGCAIVTFLYFNWQGIKHHSVGYYLLTFAGSPRTAGDWLWAFCFFPSNSSARRRAFFRLTVRLWANIFASDLLYVIFLGLLFQPAVWGWNKSRAWRGPGSISGADSACLYRTSYLCCHHSDVRFYSFAVHLYRYRDGGRALVRFHRASCLRVHGRSKVSPDDVRRSGNHLLAVNS